MPTILTRFPPWLSAVLLAMAMVIGLTLPDYGYVFDHAPTSFVCVDTSRAVELGAPIPMAIVLARNRETKSERVDIYVNAESSASNCERASDSGMSNPLKHRKT